MDSTQIYSQSQSIPTGWYRDPENPNLDRWWDGKRWTEMTMPSDGSAPRIYSPEEYAKQRALQEETNRMIEELQEKQHAEENEKYRSGKVRLLIAISKLADVFVKLSITIGVVFVLSILPVTFTPLGQWQIGGMPLITIASYIARISIYGALLSSAVAMPIIALCRKGIWEQLLDQSWSAYILENGVMDEDYLLTKRYVTMAKEATAKQQYCTIIAFLVAAFAAFLVHDLLILQIGNPWTDIITLITIPIVAGVIGSVYTSSISKQYELEDKAMYTRVKTLLDNPPF